RPLAAHPPRHGLHGGSGRFRGIRGVGAAGVPHPARRRRDRALRSRTISRHRESRRRHREARKARGATRDAAARLRLPRSFLAMRIQVNARNRGYEFDAQPGQSVLYAGLSAGIELPYECATGTCGTCKAKLVAGRVRDGWREAPGRKYLKGGAEFLMCQCAPEEALTVEVPGFVYAMELGTCVPEASTATLRNVRRLTDDVIGFALELEAPRDFDAGQFVLLAAPGVPGYRAFSMSNFARGARRLELIAKRKPAGGFSEWPALVFERGLVHEVAKRAMAGKFQNLRAYVAGPPPAVDAAIRMLLLEARLTTDNIRYDKYS